MDSGDDDFGSNGHHEPLWRHVNIYEGNDSLDGENVRFLCDYCNRVFRGSYSTVEAHLLKACEGVTATIRAQIRNEFMASKHANIRTMPSDVPLTHTAAGSYPDDILDIALVQSKKRKRTSIVDENHCMEIRDHLDAIIARMFYSSGLPFSAAKNPYYQNSFSLATRKKDISGITNVENDSCMESDLVALIARIFYSSGLSSNIARNPYYLSSLSIASMTHIPGYVPPEPKKL
uniref:BED-type domain-containing protein n=1 Tax=Arundo donax TaxID=35708 RepID=A0A0A8Y0R3_ARUDO